MSADLTEEEMRRALFGTAQPEHQGKRPAKSPGKYHPRIGFLTLAVRTGTLVFSNYFWPDLSRS